MKVRNIIRTVKMHFLDNFYSLHVRLESETKKYEANGSNMLYYAKFWKIYYYNGMSVIFIQDK